MLAATCGDGRTASLEIKAKGEGEADQEEESGRRQWNANVKFTLGPEKSAVPVGEPVRQRAFARASVQAAGLHELSVGCKLFSYILQFKDSRPSLACTDNQ